MNEINKQLKINQIYNSDVFDFLKQLPQESIDLVIIEDKKRETIQAIASYNSMIRECGWLRDKLNNLRFTKLDGLEKISDESFLGRRINDFIQQLEKRQSDAFDNKKTGENYLLTYNEWETKWNQQLEEIVK